MSTSEIINTVVARKFLPTPSSFQKRGLSPVRDWLIGVFVFVVLLILGGVLSAFQFMEYADISVPINTPVQDTVEYNESTVDAALRMYGSKKVEFTALEKGSDIVPPKVAPASIPALSTSSSPVVEKEVSATTSSGVVQMAN